MKLAELSPLQSATTFFMGGGGCKTYSDPSCMVSGGMTPTPRIYAPPQNKKKLPLIWLFSLFVDILQGLTRSWTVANETCVEHWCEDGREVTKDLREDCTCPPVSSCYNVDDDNQWRRKQFASGRGQRLK